jgi:hypothetical protein
MLSSERSNVVWDGPSDSPCRTHLNLIGSSALALKCVEARTTSTLRREVGQVPYSLTVYIP